MTSQKPGASPCRPPRSRATSNPYNVASASLFQRSADTVVATPGPRPFQAKRAEIAGQIEHTQDQLRQFVTSFTIDAAIHIFDRR